MPSDEDPGPTARPGGSFVSQQEQRALQDLAEQELARRLADAPHSPETLAFAARIGRDLPGEYVAAHRSQLDALLKVRCGSKRCLLAELWSTPWGRWLECRGSTPTPAGWREIASADDEHTPMAAAVSSIGHYPSESGLLAATPQSNPLMAMVAEAESRLTPLERAGYESYRVIGHTHADRARHASCRCAAWRFTDAELVAAADAQRRSVVLTAAHRHALG